MESPLDEDLDDCSVRLDELGFGSAWDRGSGYVVAVVIIEYEDIPVSAGRRSQEGSSLVCVDAPGGLKTVGKDLIGFCWLGFCHIV